VSTFIVGLDENIHCRLQSIMLTPEQCRAARGWLDWSQDVLAVKAKVSLSTVRDFEKGRRTPIANNLAALEGVLMGAGIRLAPMGITGPLAIQDGTSPSIHGNAGLSVDGGLPTTTAHAQKKRKISR
jgi:hypothetical protein